MTHTERKGPSLAAIEAAVTAYWGKKTPMTVGVRWAGHDALVAAYAIDGDPVALRERVEQLERGNAIIDPAYVAAIHRAEELTAQRDALVEALELSLKALTEAEAILGGEYGDHYATLCETMLDLRERSRTTLQSIKTKSGE